MIGQFALLALVAVLGVRRRGRRGTAVQRATAGALGVALMLAGIVAVVRGASDLGEGLTPMPRPRPGAPLVDTGVYGRVRHPIYAAVILLAVGWAIAAASRASLVAAGLLALWMDAKARREEAWLNERFAGYEAYRARTRRFVPGVY